METETSGPKCKCFPHHNKIFMGFFIANHCRVGLWEVIFQAPNFPGSDTIEAWNIEFGASSREGASARMMQKLPVWDSNFSAIAVNVSRPRGSQRGNTICFSRFTQSSFLCFYVHLFVDDSAGDAPWILFDSLCFPTKLGGYGHLTLVSRRRGDARRAGWWWRRCAAAAFEIFFHMGWDQDEIKMGKR